MKKGAIIWKAIPPPVKIVGGIIVSIGTYMLLRPRDKPPKLFSKKTPYIDPKLIGTGIASIWSPTPLANELYQAMKPTNWGMLVGVGSNAEAAWKKLFQMSDSAKIVAVYNDYNKIAQKNRDPLTLTQKIRDESSSLYGSYKPELLIKLDTLGLL